MVEHVACQLRSRGFKRLSESTRFRFGVSAHVRAAFAAYVILHPFDSRLSAYWAHSEV